MSTGYVYDAMFLEHNLVGHPESRERLEAILQCLEQKQVLDRLDLVPARPATQAELTLVHTPEHIHRVQKISEKGGGYLDSDTYLSAASHQAGLLAAGGTIDAATAVVDGRLDNAFALVRPPGHHAVAGYGMGFCLFNNIVAAAAAVREQGMVERILIVDFDVHHGNGTQSLTEDDPSICLVSSHQYPHYPGTGAITDIGRGQGKGSVVNIPIPPGMGDQAFQDLYEGVVAPVARRFRPELILVSAGFDAHWDDPLAGLTLSLGGYDWIVRTLLGLAQELCQGRIVFVLEGGYHLPALSHAVLNAFWALLGDDRMVDPLGPSPWAGPAARQLVGTLRELHRLD
jgi:acetoin utilization deacetylase AcuC-like enzyme